MDEMINSMGLQEYGIIGVIIAAVYAVGQVISVKKMSGDFSKQTSAIDIQTEQQKKIGRIRDCMDRIDNYILRAISDFSLYNARVYAEGNHKDDVLRERTKMSDYQTRMKRRIVRAREFMNKVYESDGGITMDEVATFTNAMNAEVDNDIYVVQ